MPDDMTIEREASYVTQTEIDAMQTSSLTRETPFLIRGVSQSQFSIARHYGAATFNGSQYTYFCETDELVRDDVVKFVKSLRKERP